MLKSELSSLLSELVGTESCAPEVIWWVTNKIWDAICEQPQKSYLEEDTSPCKNTFQPLIEIAKRGKQRNMKEFDVGFGFKPPNLKLKVSPSYIEVKIKCIRCGNRHHYNVNDENEIEVDECPHCRAAWEKEWLDRLPGIIKKAGYK